MKLPYGQSNYKNVATEFYYVDRTQYIEKLEDLANRFLFYLRPRKFGKSLFISMLGHYYGEQWKGQFGDLFGKYHVGKHPTPLANKYLVLNFDFSGILTDTKELVFEHFMAKVRRGIQDFFTDYASYFDSAAQVKQEERDSPGALLTRFFGLVHRYAPGKKIYVIIDEYDHFANELIAFHLEDFKEIVSRNGFVRKFYEVIKEETKTGLVERMFATGVSPVTVDSLTSGFNIGLKISLDLGFHEMMGFTEAEAMEMLGTAGVPDLQMPAVLQELRGWYNGYLFNPDAPNRLYNPNMLIYFGDYFQRHRKPPEKMLDENIASDYGKIQRMLGVGGNEYSLNILEEVLAKGESSANLTTQFSFDRRWVRDDYLSLLFYLGMLTIRERAPIGYQFSAPNFVIKQLYYEYFLETLRLRAKLGETMYDDAREALLAMVTDSNLSLFVSLVEKIINRLSVRDARKFNESNLKAIFAALLVSSKVYLVHSETEIERRFVDLLCIRLPSIPVKWNFAFELKYLKKSDAALLEQKKLEARQQLQEYLQTDDLRNVPDLAAYAIVFVGSAAKSVEQLQ